MEFLFTLITIALIAPLSLTAVPTSISVSVLSHDAKFVGSDMGGMHITIRELLGGELLASGKTLGSTGDTKRIMADTRERDLVLLTEGSARFDAVLDLKRPTRVRIEATGPLAQLQSAATVTEIWTLLPGKDYSEGNGIILRLPGMVVDVLAPPAHLKTEATNSVEVTANVAKMCGCPIGEKTPWPVDRYSVEARLYEAGGELLQVVPLDYTGAHSQFSGAVPVPGPGAYEIIVTAFDPATKDSGADTTTIILN